MARKTNPKQVKILLIALVIVIVLVVALEVYLRSM